MTAKEARRWADGTIADLILQYIDAGQPYLDCFDGQYKAHRRTGNNHEDCADCVAIEGRLREIAGRYSYLSAEGWQKPR